MAKRVIDLIIKLVLFFAVMMMVAKFGHYDDLVNNIMNKYVSFDTADKLGKLLFGEADPEPYESVSYYINILINLLISVPLLSAMITVFNVITNRVKFTEHLSECALSIVRRFVKIFIFTFLFLGVFRIFPYEIFISDNQRISFATMATVVGFNLLITIVFYYFSARLVNKRNW
ncbi:MULTISPECIES: hypothetical protein [unclassified Brenneria]|uniref:hypothetical protein n=1 Tax=unclassified Brenneria TaxID=2634434 RepID=UPI0029C26D60|nr:MULTISPECIES: hypothetical protein [unclassified Brenneria]MDX5629765.1 hypothetical protein [Brenneria sp. L3-3Z]MDX5696911.1 hypothetical protein [Brenneria sp. L4-2C]